MSSELYNVRIEDLLGRPLSADYVPAETYFSHFVTSRSRPPFTIQIVTDMLTDPRIKFGLWLIKGPILSNARFFVQCENEEIKEFIINQINRFWRGSAPTALKAIEYGYSGSEVIYTFKNGLLQYQRLRGISSKDVTAVTKDGEFVGMYVESSIFNKRMYIGRPKAFWHIHWRDIHPWYGRSRLFGAFVPWWEMWAEGGYRDIRSLWFHKNAYDGGAMYHPPGETQLRSGETISNKELARDMIEKKKTGASLAIPNIPTADGGKAWEYQPPSSNPTPDGFVQYGESLRDEIWEGLTIPPEIAKAEGTGAYAGRRVPHQAFMSILQEISNWLMLDFDEQIVRVLVHLNWGEVDYEIIPFPLLREEDKEQQETENPPNAEQTSDPDAQQDTQMSHAVGDRSQLTKKELSLVG